MWWDLAEACRRWAKEHGSEAMERSGDVPNLGGGGVGGPWRRVWASLGPRETCHSGRKNRALQTASYRQQLGGPCGPGGDGYRHVVHRRTARWSRVQTFELPADESAPGLARACVYAVAAPDDPTAADDLVLLTSEVVANVVKSGKQTPERDITLRIDLGDPVRVEVLDAGSGHGPDPGARAGWGVSLLARLARTWGVEREGDRTKVWFELGS